MNAHTRQFAASISLAIACCMYAVMAVHSKNEPSLRRVTVTPEHSLNLNPTVSGDGRHVAFESTGDLAVTTGVRASFHTLRADLTPASAAFTHVAASRAAAPALSRDGSRVAFASRENLTGENADGNSELFLFAAGKLQQITATSPRDPGARSADGNFQPSISDDGQHIAFASNRDLTGANADANLEIFLYDANARVFSQITDTSNIFGSTDAKISGDGSRVAFIRDDGAAGEVVSQQRELLLFERAANSTRVVASNISGLALTYGRATSDDGGRVVFAAQTAARTTQVFLYDAPNARVRQITALGPRASDVPLHPTISGDGSRIAFATRRNLAGGNSDASVELYLYDLPTGKFSRVTDAPAAATAEVVSSLNEDGSLVAFNFPRVLSEPVSDSEFVNNSEIYLARLDARVPFSTDLQLLNGASFNKDPSTPKAFAPEQIAVARGVNLTLDAVRAEPLPGGLFPRRLGGATLTVNGRQAQLFYASPTQINFLVPAETETGTAQIVVRNHDGYESRATVTVTNVAPGLFTEGGDGSGAAIALDAQTQLRAPFDPFDTANAARRITIFATGIRHARDVTVSLGGRVLTVESVRPSPGLPGLDEIQVVLARSLAGAGVAPLEVRADGRASNPATINLNGTRRAASITLAPSAIAVGLGRSARYAATVRDEEGLAILNAPVAFNSSDESIATVDAQGRVRGVGLGTATIKATSGALAATANLKVFPLTLAINEVLADPPDGAAGDANKDGTRSASQDEFVEIVNASTADLDIGGYQITTRGGNGADIVRHTFAARTVVAPGAAVVIFGGVERATFNPAHPAFAGALVLTASTGGLSLTNGGSAVKLLDPSRAIVEELNFGEPTELEGDRNQSLTRAPDVAGDFVLHTTAMASGARLFSPGARTDGAAFNITAPVARIEIAPAAADIEPGERQQFNARAYGADSLELRGVVFRWHSSDASVATIDDDGLADARAAGAVEIKASARGVESVPALLRVAAPKPKVARVEIAPHAASINRGGTLRFSARAFDGNGQAVDGAVFTWSSGNALVAAIDSAGLARGTGVGSIQITASTPDGAGGRVAQQASLEVGIPLVINEILADVPPDDPATATVEGDANGDGARNSGDDEFVELFNRSNEPVDISGLIVSDATARRFTIPGRTTLAAGRALVVFGGGTPPGADASFGGALVFRAASLGLNDAGDTVSLKLALGDAEVTLTAQPFGTAAPSAPPAPADQSLVRVPDATLGATGGNFNAHTLAPNAAARPFSPGTRADGTPFNAPPLSRISIAPATSAIEIGAMQTFEARAYALRDGVEVEVPDVSFAWDSSDATKAPVAPASGTETSVRGTSSGHAQIRARAGGAEATATINVKPPPPVLARLVLAPETATVILGGAQEFTAQAFDQYGQPFPAASINFASSDTAVATVDLIQHTAGRSDARASVSGRATGTAQVNASAADDGGHAVASNAVTLTVNAPPPTITRIEIAPPSATIGAGASQQFTAKAFDQTDRELSGVAFNWTTSDAAIATIDAGGRATGRSAGTCGVRAASAGVTSAPATLTVKMPPPGAPVAGQVIINEALVAFASSSAETRRDFVELYNPTDSTLDITGLTVTFRPSGAGNTPVSVTIANASGDRFFIQPHGYFLIANGASTFGVAADFAASNLDLNNTTGAIKIELGGIKLDGLAYQSGTTPPAAPFNAFGEGAILIFNSGTTNDLIRSPNAADTDSNATDFRRNGTITNVSPNGANP